MSLSVKVISYQGEPPLKPLSIVFDRKGGTLGRAEDNDFVLPDPDRYVSRKHALISFENGIFYLADDSTEGTFINNNEQPVHHSSVQLADGDELRIGDYDLIVAIIWDEDEIGPSGAPAPEQPSEMPEDFDIEEMFKNKCEGKSYENFEPRSGTAPNRDGNQGAADEIPSPHHASADDGANHNQSRELPNDFDIKKLFNNSTKGKKGDFNNADGVPINEEGSQATPEFATRDALSQSENLQQIPEHYIEELFGKKGGGDAPEDVGSKSSKPPRDSDSSDEHREVQPGKEGEHNNDLSNGRSTDEPAPDSLNTSRQESDQALKELFSIFLVSAGIKDTSFLRSEEIPELMRSIGAVFKEMITGLFVLLQARKEMKVEFQIPDGTQMQPVGNNPFKSAEHITDVLDLILTKKYHGFIDAAEAVREGFADIKTHQFAMFTGFKASLLNLLRQFNPENYEKQYQQGIPFQKKAKFWEAYSEAFHYINQNAMDNIFDDAFTRAYQEQIRKMRSAKIERDSRSTQSYKNKTADKRLMLKVLSYKGGPPPEPLSASFGKEGGTLGRARGNTFFLPDPDQFVSGEHAVIRFESGCFHFRDKSTNGTFVSNKNLCVHEMPKKEVQLDNGDELRIGDYDIVVSIV